jgi:YHS domain-containing protein
VKFSRAEYANEFKKDPAKYLAKIQQAYKDAKPYPLDICLVSGEKFTMGPPFTFVYEGREIKMCCDGCLDDFQKTPAKYLTIWDHATARMAALPAQIALQAALSARK